MTKQELQAIAPKGYRYTGQDYEHYAHTGKVEHFYLFQTGDYSTGFKEMRCLECDLTEKNLALMARLNMTR